MRYDPNYSYDDEEEGEGSGGDDSDDADQMSVDGEGSDAEEGSDYGEDEDGGGSDDDDTSWKVLHKYIYMLVNCKCFFIFGCNNHMHFILGLINTCACRHLNVVYFANFTCHCHFHPWSHLSYTLIN